MSDVQKALEELVTRFIFHRDMALTIYGESEDTPPTVTAFNHAIRLTEQLKEELE